MINRILQVVPFKKLAAWGTASALLISAPGFPCCQAVAAGGIADVAPVTNGGGVLAPGVFSAPDLNFAMGATNGPGAASLVARAVTPAIQGVVLTLTAAPAAGPAAGPAAAAAEGLPFAAQVDRMGNGVLVKAEDALVVGTQKLESATVLREVAVRIGMRDKTESNGPRMWASLARFWENSGSRRASNTPAISGFAEVSRRTAALNPASRRAPAEALGVPAALRDGVAASRGPSILARLTAGAAFTFVLPGAASAAEHGRALTLSTVTNPDWLLSGAGVSFWLPIAGVALSGIVGMLAPKAEMAAQTYLSTRLKPMSKIGRETLNRLKKTSGGDSVDDHDKLVGNVIEKLGYEHVYTAGEKYVLKIPSDKSPAEAQAELRALGIVDKVAAISVARPERPIESRIATMVPVSVAVFFSGLLLSHAWSGFFTALVFLGLAQETSRYTKTLAGVTIPLLMTIPSAIIGFYVDSPVAAFFHALVIVGMFGIVARKNIFGSYFAGRQLNLDRGSLLTMLGLPMAALSVYTLWIGWPIVGFFGLSALAVVVESGVSSGAGTPKAKLRIKIRIR